MQDNEVDINTLINTTTIYSKQPKKQRSVETAGRRNSLWQVRHKWESITERPSALLAPLLHPTPHPTHPAHLLAALRCWSTDGWFHVLFFFFPLFGKIIQSYNTHHNIHECNSFILHHWYRQHSCNAHGCTCGGVYCGTAHETLIDSLVDLLCQRAYNLILSVLQSTSFSLKYNFPLKLQCMEAHMRKQFD